MNIYEPKISNCAGAMLNAEENASHIRDHFGAMFWAVIAPINNLAVMETKTAYDLLKKSKLFKREIKRNAKLTMERIDKYDNAVVRTMRNNLNGDRSQYWLDYSDEHYSYMQHDLDIFYLSVLQVLTKFNEDEREVKARLVTSHALLNYAIGMFDAYFKKVEEKCNISIENLYKAARLSYVQSTWCEVVNAICVTQKPMDVDGDRNVKLAFQVIERHLLDMNKITDIGEVALSYNPDVKCETYENPLNNDEQFSKSFDECFKK